MKNTAQGYTDMCNTEKIIRESALRTEKALADCFERGDESFRELLDSEKYSLFAGGKRIRPFIVKEFCKMFGGDETAALPFACAVEMIHTYSLIHDDLPCMDNDDMRRGKPTNHKVYGYATALLAGDALLTRAFETAAQSKLPPESVVCALSSLAAAAGDFGMIGGQIMDMGAPGRELDFETLLKLQRHKTGALMRVSAKLGCLAAGLGEDSTETCDAIRYADAVGLAFQVTDDILDVTGDAQTLGKNTGMDAAMSKTTFLSFYSINEAREYARGLTLEAIDAISEYENSEVLTDLAVYLLERDR